MPSLKSKTDLTSSSSCQVIFVHSHQRDMTEIENAAGKVVDPISSLETASDFTESKVSAVEQRMIEAARKRDEGFYEPKDDVFRTVNLRQLDSSSESSYVPSISKGIVSEFSSEGFISVDKGIPSNPFIQYPIPDPIAAKFDRSLSLYRAKVIAHGML